MYVNLGKIKTDSQLLFEENHYVVKQMSRTSMDLFKTETFHGALCFLYVKVQNITSNTNKDLIHPYATIRAFGEKIKC